ncbi:Diacylglycerol kinase [Rubripirellula obstinata]|uniref:Diacylglycerol kinase n=1 Tax=Rubripirellula obstinata TaxID=406547 RepID=A0A5B1CC21_9BACT|nr:diacylglycerol kinase family protein [Rubripirellula obstinata]KAA1258677.1 Diacylglycerol kinase [Rubripirellula obstinata]
MNLPRPESSSTVPNHPSPVRRRVVVLTSPKAGSGANRTQIPRLMDLLAATPIEAALTHDPSDLDHLSAEALASGESIVVVAAGGDGTVTLAASKLLAASNKLSSVDQALIPIVPMPLGTENLLARHFGHRVEAEHVFNTIVAGTQQSIDLGSVRSSANSRVRPMLTMATCGFDAEVVRNLHLRRSGHIRRSSYLVPITRVLRQYRFPELTIEAVSDHGEVEREIRCGWAMVYNLPCYGGGLTIEPDAIGDDGLLDVIAFQGRSIASGLRYVAGIKTGRHLKFADTIRFRAPAVRIHATDRVHFQVDGDYAGRLPIEIGVRPKAVKLLLPPVN